MAALRPPAGWLRPGRAAKAPRRRPASTRAARDRSPPPPAAIQSPKCSADQYEAMHRRSLEDPDGLGGEQAQRIDWDRATTRIANWSFDPVDIKWFRDGILNLCFNGVD